MVYKHQSNGALICRCSALVSNLSKRNEEENGIFLETVRRLGVLPNGQNEPARSICIIDSRSKSTAEKIASQKYVDYFFCDLPEFEVLRENFLNFIDTFKKLLPNNTTEVAYGLSSTSFGLHLSSFVNREFEVQTVRGNSEISFVMSDPNHFSQQFKWLQGIQYLLRSSLFTAQKVHLENVSILVQCFSGYDQSAQISSLTQILLDPYYRTVKGLCALIEKEWCSFGFGFKDRSGEYIKKSQSKFDVTAPFFLQFFDCVYQLIHQFPSAFEFSDDLLVFFLDHSTSNLFGNFLGNSEKERHVRFEMREKTESIWSYIIRNKKVFTNANYERSEFPLWPVIEFNILSIWARYYCRWIPSSHPSFMRRAVWRDRW